MVGRRPGLAIALSTRVVRRGRDGKTRRASPTPPTASAGGRGGNGGGSVPRTDPLGAAAVGVNTPRTDSVAGGGNVGNVCRPQAPRRRRTLPPAATAAAGGRVRWELCGAAGGVRTPRNVQAGRGGPPAQRRNDRGTVGGRRRHAPFATPSQPPSSFRSPCVGRPCRRLWHRGADDVATRLPRYRTQRKQKATETPARRQPESAAVRRTRGRAVAAATPTDALAQRGGNAGRALLARFGVACSPRQDGRVAAWQLRGPPRGVHHRSGRVAPRCVGGGGARVGGAARSRHVRVPQPRGLVQRGSVFGNRSRHRPFAPRWGRLHRRSQAGASDEA